ncbi:MAG: cation transporter [Pyrinomonadaceae bacterium]|nr:cation transporter [Phycisphaerales bacterium]
MKTMFAIQGMHCPACAKRLTEAFGKVHGVTSAHVTLTPPEVHIESDGLPPMEALDRAARSAGNYSVVAPSLVLGQTPAAIAHELAADTSTSAAGEPKPSLYPLGLIVAFIAGTALLTTFVRGGGESSWHTFMLDFMAGFFLVFSFFKLLDLRGFADAYQSYDIVARRSRSYALIYPFLELALGIAYLVRFQPMATNIATLVLMLVGSIGVLRAVMDRKAIRCACLGTALNLPMTTVTLVEDLGMAAMAAIGIIWSQ